MNPVLMSSLSEACVSSIIPMMDKTQVNSDCEFYDIYRLLIFLTKCGPYDAMAPSQKLLTSLATYVEITLK